MGKELPEKCRPTRRMVRMRQMAKPVLRAEVRAIGVGLQVLL